MKKTLMSLAVLAMAGAAHAADAAAPAAATADASSSGKMMAAALAIAIAAFGGALGQGMAAAKAMEGIARQPEAGGRIGTNMIIAAALIEGFTFTAIILAFVLANSVK